MPLKVPPSRYISEGDKHKTFAAGEPSSREPVAGAESAHQNGPSNPIGEPSSSKQARHDQEEYRESQARIAIGKLPAEYLSEIASILGRAKLNDSASAKTTSVAQYLVDCAPEHRRPMLAALQHQLYTYARPVIP